MITIFKYSSESNAAHSETIVSAENVDAALEQVVKRVTDDGPELMALAEDLRFIKDPSPGEHKLESGYVLVVE